VSAIHAVELWLAEILAELYARDYKSMVVWLPETEYLPDLDDAELEAYAEGFVEAALDKLAAMSASMRRPRTALEMMIDRACGIEVRDGVVAEFPSVVKQ
jgi:hypothetical protein